MIPGACGTLNSRLIILIVCISIKRSLRWLPHDGNVLSKAGRSTVEIFFCAVWVVAVDAIREKSCRYHVPGHRHRQESQLLPVNSEHSKHETFRTINTETFKTRNTKTFRTRNTNSPLAHHSPVLLHVAELPFDGHADPAAPEIVQSLQDSYHISGHKRLVNNP